MIKGTAVTMSLLSHMMTVTSVTISPLSCMITVTAVTMSLMSHMVRVIAVTISPLSQIITVTSVIISPLSQIIKQHSALGFSQEKWLLYYTNDMNIEVANSSTSDNVATWTMEGRLTLRPNITLAPTRRFFRVGTAEVSSCLFSSYMEFKQWVPSHTGISLDPLEALEVTPTSLVQLNTALLINSGTQSLEELRYVSRCCFTTNLLLSTPHPHAS